jgi:hypothetical protein
LKNGGRVDRFSKALISNALLMIPLALILLVLGQDWIVGAAVGLWIAVSAAIVVWKYCEKKKTWRGLYIFFGACGTGSVFWVISIIILRMVFGLGADPAALQSVPVFLLGCLLGAYLGDRSGKRRNYRNPFATE